MLMNNNSYLSIYSDTNPPSRAWKQRAMPQAESQSQEIKRLREELKRQRERCEAQERFTAIILHECGNYLAVIRTSSQIVSGYYDRLSRDAIVQHLSTVDKNVGYLTDVVKDLSEVANTQCSPASQVDSEVDVKTLTEHCAQQLMLDKPQAAQITMSSSGNLENLRTDSKLLRSILVNLLSNAIKYSPDASPIQVDLCGTADNITFTIRDQGIGIPAEGLKQLFTPFYRASNAKNRKGTGLGLAIVKRNVEMLGGTITVESEVNKGTTFIVTLPRTGVK